MMSDVAHEREIAHGILILRHILSVTQSSVEPLVYVYSYIDSYAEY